MKKLSIFALSTCIILAFVNEAFSQSKLYVPNAVLSNTQSSNGGIGIDISSPLHPLHVFEETDGGIGVKIDLEEVQEGLQGGGTFITQPKYALQIDYKQFGLTANTIFAIDSDGRLFSGYQSGTEQVISSSSGVGVYRTSTNKISIKYSGNDPQIAWNSATRRLTFVNENTSARPLTLESSGKVAVGTSNFSGNSTLRVENGSMTDVMRIQDSNDWGTDDDFIRINQGISPYLEWSSTSNQNFEFRSDTVTPLRLSPEGKVGINTDNFSNSNHSLYIAGSSIAEEMYVKLQSQWGDFVFEKDYNLMPLEDLEIYLNENKHLPDFPSSQVIEDEGIPLGETERLLTIKVEELTLYILQLKAEIDQLKKQNLE